VSDLLSASDGHTPVAVALLAERKVGALIVLIVGIGASRSSPYGAREPRHRLAPRVEPAPAAARPR